MSSPSKKQSCALKSNSTLQNSIFDDDDDLPESVRRVINLPELREIIIGYAIYSNYFQTIDPWSSRLIRRVSKTWLLSVSQVIRNNHYALHTLLLNSSTCYKKNNTKRKFLNKFVKDYSIPPIPGCVNYFSLEIWEDFFTLENKRSLQNCFVKCGAGLVKLEMCMPYDEAVFPDKYSKALSLPNLKTMIVYFYGNSKPSSLPKLEDASVVQLQTEIMNFIKLLLNATSSLTELKLGNGWAPQNFQNLQLPQTISTLELNCGMTSDELRILLNNQLSNLTNLTLLLTELPFEDGLILEVLQKYREQLKALSFSAFVSVTKFAMDVLRFPVMACLKNLHFRGMYCKLITQSRNLGLCFPKLESMSFSDTQPMKNPVRWIKSPKLTGLRELKVISVEIEPNIADELEINLRHFDNHRGTLPFVRKLTVNITVLEEEIAIQLKHVFLNAPELVNLTIVCNLPKGEDFEDNFWDELLTGYSRRMMNGLRNEPDVWEHRFSLDETNDLPSIQRLIELETLTLMDIGNESTVDSSNEIQNSAAESWISDLAFTHALLPMSTMKDLNLSGRFKVSPAMVQKWEEQNRILLYQE